MVLLSRRCPALILACCLAAAGSVRGQDEPTSNARPEAGSHVDRYGDPLPEGAVARLGTVRYRRLNGIHFLADSRTVIGTRGSTLAWVDVATGRTIRERDLADYTWEENGTLLSLSPDRSLAAVRTRRMLGDDDEYTMTIAETGTGDVTSQLQWKRSEGDFPEAACFTPDNRRLLTTDRYILRVWDLDSGKLESKTALPVEEANEAVALSPDGALLAVRDHRGARLWNWRTGEDQALPGLERGIDAAAFTADGTKLATMSDELNGVRLWDVATHRLLWRGSSGVSNTSYGSRIAFSSDGRWLVAPAYPPSVQLWDVETGELEATLDTGELEPREVALSPDERWLMVDGHPGFAGAGFQIWDLTTRQRLGSEYAGHQQPPTAIHFTPDAGQIVTGANDSVVNVWDGRSGQLERQIGHEAGSMLTALAVSLDGEFIASGSHDETVVIWNRNTGERLYTLVGHGRLGGGAALRFTPEGRRLLSFGDDWFLRAFDVSTGKAVIEHAIRLEDVPLEEAEDGSISLEGMDFRAFDRMPNEVFTPDGSRLVLGVGNSLYVVDVETGRELTILAAGSTDRIVVSPDSRLVATIQSGPYVETPLLGGGVRSSASEEQAVVVHSLETGRVVHEIRLPNGYARDVAFSSDGEKLAVNLNSIHVYEITSRRELARIECNPPAAWAVAFSPDGERLAASHFDGSVLVWDWRKFAIDSTTEQD